MFFALFRNKKIIPRIKKLILLVFILFRTIPGPAKSIAMIVSTPELIATECNRCPGWPGASFDSSTQF